LSALLEAVDVRVRYRHLEAVRGVTLSVERGERVGLIGESGSGKSSLARALLGLEPLAGGSVHFDGQPMHGAKPGLRRRFQPVFQDVGAALDPKLRIRAVLAEPFQIHGRPFDDAMLSALLTQVQLSAELLGRLPHELSVGQRQRVNLARALALEPELLLLDEPVSALDVSVQAQVLNLLSSITRQRSLSLLVITHDLDVVAQLCTRVAVMYAGRIVEGGTVAEVLEQPLHPYTRLLVESRRQIVEATGEPASLHAVPSGCAFHPRCPHAVDRCRSEDPKLTGTHHSSACFVFGPLDSARGER
jgi:oligopeptide/dipeptide ABC transporter ATP-binding protein